MTLPPTDQPLRDQAKEIAQDPDVKELWSSAIGAEAAPILQPIVERTARVAAKRLLAPLQAAMEELKKDANARRQEAQARQADAYVSEFRSEATKNGWDLTPEVETRMAQIAEGFVSRFSRPGEPIPGLHTREENTRRERRCQFIFQVLEALGFKAHRRGDILVGRLEKYNQEVIQQRLSDLGRLTLCCRQLDMLMQSNDSPDYFARAFLTGDLGRF